MKNDTMENEYRVHGVKHSTPLKVTDKSTTYLVDGFRIVIDETPKHREYAVFDADNNLLCTLDGTIAEEVAKALLKVIHNYE